MPLTPCPHCGCHTLDPQAPCPHCRSEPSGAMRTSAAVLLGLALAGCPMPMPEYGVTVTDYTDKITETSETGTTGTGTTETGTDTGTTYGPCLDYPPPSGDTGTTYGPCLDYPPPSGDTGTATRDTPTGTPPASSRRVLFERLSADGVLPADVVRRLRGGD